MCVLTVASAMYSRGGDLGVGGAGRHLEQHLALAGRQRRQQRIRRRGRPAGQGVGDVVEQPAGRAGRHHGVTGGDGPDRAEQLLRSGVLQQEPAGPGPQRGEDVLVEVEGGQHQHLRPARHRRTRRRSGRSPAPRPSPASGRPSAPRRRRSAAGRRVPAGVDRGRTVGGLADHRHVRLGLDQHPKARAHQHLVVDQVRPGWSSLRPQGSGVRRMRRGPAGGRPARRTRRRSGVRPAGCRPAAAPARACRPGRARPRQPGLRAAAAVVDDA